ncbi:MAG: dihydrolipoyl dehydrogenase family protein [Anaerolineae bacterium]
MSIRKMPIAVIGAGAGGLVIANGAAKAGKKVLLIENGRYGGDCTNFGCIPSKSLIASAHAAYALKEAYELGLKISESPLDASRCLERVREIIKEIRSEEDPAALQKNGVETLTGFASFQDPHTLIVKSPDGKTTQIEASHIVIATGSTPFIPDVEGLKKTPFLTNETIFDLKAIPKRLIILGGGPIGSELAQAFLRLGSQVSLVHKHEELLNKEEKLAQTVLANQCAKEGMQLFLGFQVESVHYEQDEFTVVLTKNGSTQKKIIRADALLVATGRRPTLQGLGLENAEVNYDEKGIHVDAYGRTNQKHIFAVGDVTGGPLFTHAAENQARSILVSLLLPSFLKKRLDRKQSVPRVTYTDPEIASVGLSEEAAKKIYKPSSLAIYVVPFTVVDRAITAGRTEGFVKVVTKKWSSRILGATIVAPRAGEMLMQLSTAMHAGIPLRKLANLIHPFPTYSLSIRKAADLWLTQTIIPFFKGRPN